MVLLGDHGGTVYLTVPARLVTCDEQALHTLLSDLDAVTWMGGEPGTVALERRLLRVGDPVDGGDGGGTVVDGVWSHPSWIADDVAAAARGVVAGRVARIPTSLLRRRREERLRSVRSSREALSRVVVRGEVLPWDFDIGEPTVPFSADD